MSINSINSINTLNNIQQTGKVNKTESKGNEFSNVLEEAIDMLDQSQKATQSANLSLLTGDVDNIHSVIIEAEKAEIALSLALQIRNKIIESYNDIMRIQI